MIIGTMPPENKSRLSVSDWSDLTTLEPRLIALERDARKAGLSSRGDWTDWPAWLRVKTRMIALVGFGASVMSDSRLRTSTSYDVAYSRLFAVFCGRVPQ